VAVNHRGHYYKKWFTCSPQFFNLVVLLKRGLSPDNDPANKLTLQQALSHVDCAQHVLFQQAPNKYGGGHGPTLKEKQDALHCHDYEWAARSGFDLYREIVAYVMGEPPSDQVSRLASLLVPSLV
jgi:hypothetical protein